MKSKPWTYLCYPKTRELRTSIHECSQELLTASESIEIIQFRVTIATNY
jgi:hypothetical protein